MEADYDVVILGAGAAGLAAGLYSTRAMLKTVILEQLGPGGQLLVTDEIENYPGFPEGIQGPDMMELLIKQAKRFETHFFEGNVAEDSLKRSPFTMNFEDGGEVQS